MIGCAKSSDGCMKSIIASVEGASIAYRERSPARYAGSQGVCAPVTGILAVCMLKNTHLISHPQLAGMVISVHYNYALAWCAIRYASGQLKKFHTLPGISSFSKFCCGCR